MATNVATRTSTRSDAPWPGSRAETGANGSPIQTIPNTVRAIETVIPSRSGRKTAALKITATVARSAIIIWYWLP